MIQIAQYLEFIGYMIIIIFVISFCHSICTKNDQGRESSEEAEWERIEGSSVKDWKNSESSKISSYAAYPYVIHYKKPIPGVPHALTKVTASSEAEKIEVKALRGGEFIGNRMRFKVKVLNDSSYMIADITVFLISYPKEALRLVGRKDTVHFSKIEPSSFTSPTFDFLPTQDCVKGEIVAGVSYLDMRGDPHVLTTKPFIIRSVCDLLIPEQIEPEEFAKKLHNLECGEISLKIRDWTPEEMYEKALRIMGDANFYEVASKSDEEDGVIFAEISGLAKGKYTGKNIAAEIKISGHSEQRGATCILKVSGEDQAMILPAIDDLKERLSVWMCPLCGSPLTLENVEDLKDGKAIICPFCNVSIGR
jgi:hypothetical protein